MTLVDLNPDSGSMVRCPKKLVLSRGSLRELGRFYAKDDQVVLSTHGVIKGVSPAGFELIVEYCEAAPHGDMYYAYAGSGECVYFSSSLLYAPKKLATKAPGAIRHVGKRYVSDGKIVFHEGNKIDRADPGSFEALYGAYARDAKHCYFMNKCIDGAKPASFRLVCPAVRDGYEYLSADATSAYYREYLVPGAHGPSFEALRDADGRVIGATDGKRRWGRAELTDVIPQRPKRALVMAERAGDIAFHDTLLTGLEQRLATFCLLCHEGSVEAFEKFTRGRIGENSIVRSIGVLNEKLPATIAEVTRDEIRITPAGLALYRQFSEPIRGIRSVFDNIDAIFRQAME